MEDSLKIIEDLLERKKFFMYEFDKKYFKLTLSQFKNSADLNKDANADLLKRYGDLLEKINKEGQVNEVDLYELATEYKPIKLKK